jgi:hypothetical protein
MSTPSLGWRMISFSQAISPVSALRAKTLVAVPPTTIPPPIATPFGPVVGLSNVRSHFTSPVARSTAVTLEPMSWR